MTHNLAHKTPEERAALELDKARWFIARHWLTKFDRPQILKALEQCPSDEEREDMRRRLNQLRTKPEYAKAKPQNGQRAKSQSPKQARPPNHPR